MTRPEAASILRSGIVVVFAAATAIYYACPPVADNDLWGHIYFGRVILASGHVPATNQFSYTAPDYPWINHEVLAECIFALVFERLGSFGLLVLKLFVGLATIGLMVGVMARRTRSVPAIALSLVSCGSLISPGFLVRPQIFTFLGLAFLWERLDAHDRTQSWRALALVPVLFALWVNTHGGVAAGLGIFLIYVAGCSLRRDTGRERSRLAVLALLSVLALLINPYGTELLAFLWHDLGRVRAISEWQPIAPFAFSGIVYEGVLVALVIGLLAGHRARAWEGSVVAVAAMITFRHQRHLPLFAILVAPLLAETLEVIGLRLAKLARLPPLSPGAHSVIAAGLCAVAAFETARVHEIYRGLHFHILVAPDLFPVDAVRFMKRNQLAGNLAVPFDWGEYAIWHLYPACRVSVDGRYTTAYPDDVLSLSQRFQFGSSGWEAILTDADVALIDRHQPIVRHMLAEPAWQYVYSDPTALVFVRKSLADQRTFIREPRTSADAAFFFP